MAWNSYANKSELVELKTRNNVTQKFLFMTPDTDPKGTILIFPGGDGKLDLELSSNKPTISSSIKANFLVRVSDNFLSKGFNVAIIDAPSDKYEKFGMNELDNSTGKNYRMGDEQIQDAEVIIDYIQKIKTLPIWVAGTSMGCFSATNIAINLGDKIQGVLLSSLVTICDDKRNLFNIREKYPNGVLDMELNKISSPTLLMVHKNDACIVAPPEKAQLIKKALTSCSNVKLVEMTGGEQKGNKTCGATGYHGYYGIEEKAADEMVNFISQN